MNHETTIAAIATPPGEGGIAVIRLSGADAFSIASHCFSRTIKQSHHAHYGHILNEDHSKLDEVLLLPMKGPHSFTGEDVIEIHCHGGRLITQKVLSRLITLGAHPAAPGQFSHRAFLNGKLDLAQAEAVAQLIHAKNEHALIAAESQLEGTLSKKVAHFQGQLTQIAAIIEAWVDYPEEGLEFASHEEIVSQFESTLHEMESLAATFKDGKILNEGINLCILGAPNVGKSSLMNALLGFDRAIVTDIAGTTRDLLNEEMKSGHLHYNLVDTAGIRITDEVVEKEGIRRSHEAAQKADLILMMLDATNPQLIEGLPKEKTLLVWNKIDLPHTISEIDDLYSVQISAKNHTGIDQLKSGIEKLVLENGAPAKDQIIITQERHYRALNEAIEMVSKVITGLQTDLSAEFISFDLRQALKSLSLIIGTNVTEDILDEIFSKFCVGK